MSQASLLSPSVPPFPPLVYKNIPVLTTEMLAQAYEVEPKQIRQNFANNRERFVEGKHFFSVSGQELKAFRLCVENFDSQISPKIRTLTLWTERGAARHAKMLSTDTAWDVFELLEETFFRVVRPESDPALPGPVTTTPSTTADRAPLRSIVNAWARVSGMPHEACWAQLRAAFGLSNIKELPAEWIPDAIAWVQEKIDGLQRAVPASPGTDSMQRRLFPKIKHPHAPILPRHIDEAPILQLIAAIQTAHEQVEAILAPLERQAYHIAYLLDDEIRRRGNMPPYTDTAYPNTLSGLLSRSTSEGISKAIIHPARSLDEYANPGYMLLGIARQLNGRG